MLGAFASRLQATLRVTLVLLVATSFVSAQAAKPSTRKAAAPAPPPSAAAERGKSLFARDCAFCHGRDAAGGETGPDLTRSRLVVRDVEGDKIRAVVQNGRPEKGMPPFPKLPPAQVNDLIAFIRHQIFEANAKPGGRRGVDVKDLQTGNADAGKVYFNGPGRCASCHSPAGDLAGIATRYVGLELEKRMLYPVDAKAKVTLTTASGEKVSGTLAYQDEFHIALTTADGWYRSWPVHLVKFEIDDPAHAHVEQFEKYSDSDIHNLMAYLQTLK